MGMGSPEPKANQRSTQVENLGYWGHTGWQPVLREGSDPPENAQRHRVRHAMASASSL